ncbi:MAG TPA: helix-turn-helix domain-containing protein [Streptosporangiaceae bacterium]
MNVGSIGEYIRQQREQAKISLRQLASAAGVSNPYLSQIERGLRRPSAEILQQIAKGLRISAEALYVQAGILEDREPDSGVRAAVLAAPDLTERQKQVLLEIYESFRQEMSVTAEVISAGDAGTPTPGKVRAGSSTETPGRNGVRSKPRSGRDSARSGTAAAKTRTKANDASGTGAQDKAGAGALGKAKTAPEDGSPGNARTAI